MCNNITGRVFDKEHVKEWSLELMGAYEHRPTMLSPWSWGLLMEYPQDDSTFDAPDGQGGDGID